MDFMTFAIVAFLVYSFLAKKDKPPQRTQHRTEDNEQRPVITDVQENEVRDASGPARKRKENILEKVERQIRESAERLEREQRSKPAPSPQKTTPTTSGRRQDTRAAMARQEYQGVEGAWGVEGRSGYDHYRSTQGNNSSELGDIQGEAKLKATPKAAPKSEVALVSPSQRAMQMSEERLAGIFGVSSAPIVQGIIWAEVLKEPKMARGLSRR